MAIEGGRLIVSSLVNEPDYVFDAVARPGDFDGDGYIDADDIDFYVGNIGEPSSFDERLDLDGDGVITLDDHQQLIETLVETPFGQGTFVGDLNFDGSVDVLNDAFGLISGLGTLEGASYAMGDLNADGRVDVLGDAFHLVKNLGRLVDADSSVKWFSGSRAKRSNDFIYAGSDADCETFSVIER